MRVAARFLTRRISRLAVAIVVALTAVPPVAAQEDCRELIEQARRAYGEGNFDRVLVLTSGCVADRVDAKTPSHCAHER